MAVLMLLPFGWLLYTERKGPYHNTSSIADLDNDGDLDVVITNVRYETESTIWHQFTLWSNQGEGRFTPLRQETPPFGYLSATAGDIDQDGRIDLALLRSDQLEFFLNHDGSGEFGLWRSTRPSGDTGTPGSVHLGDLDNDGKLDAFVAGCCSMLFPAHDSYPESYIPSISWRWLNGVQSVKLEELQDVRVREAALGDLDGDGDLDVYAAALEPRRESQGDAADRVLLNDGKGAFIDSGLRLGNSDSTAVALGDVDGDGDLDALVGISDGGELWKNQGGDQVSFISSGKQGNDPVTSIFLSDLDMDGDLDALLGVKRRATLWWNDGKGNFSPSGLRLPISERHALAVADFNGDSYPDIFAGAYTEDHKVWLNRGNGEFYRP